VYKYKFLKENKVNESSIIEELVWKSKVSVIYSILIMPRTFDQKTSSFYW
jgi:hypothetical protein